MTIYFTEESNEFYWEEIETLWEGVIPNWEALVDVQKSYKIYLNQSVTAYPVWKLRLTSNFGNKQIEVAGSQLEWDMTLLKNNDRYSEWNIAPNADQERELDMQGYWQFEILGGPDSENLINVAQGMTKVVNQSSKKLDEKPKYVGPNPNAESYIIY